MARKTYEKTRSGLMYITFSFYVHTVMALLSGIVFYSWSQNPSSDPRSFICFLAIFGIIGMILFLVGIYKMYKGADRISWVHKNKVTIAIVIAIISYILGQIGSQMALQGQSVEAIRVSIMTRGLFNLFRNIGYGIMPILLVDEIADKKSKIYLYLGTSILIGLGIATNVYYRIGMGSIQSAEKLLLQALTVLSFTLILSSAGYLSFALGYRRIEPGKRENKRESTESIESEAPVLGDTKVCPECGEKSMKVKMDKSAFCKNCGYATKNYYDETESDEKSDSG